jgi:hypothetical protein
VWLGGDVDHADFAEAIALVRATADVIAAVSAESPEVIVLAQSRPDAIAGREVERLRRQFPLAGVVVLAGTWCEGEPRTGRPPQGVHRLYWYEFCDWWRAEMARRAAEYCPAWAWPVGRETAVSSGDPCSNRGLVLLETTCWDTADTLADVLRRAGFATAWFPPRDANPQVSGATAGVWEGRQLDDAELPRLARFCRRLRPDTAPVVALLDFPRRDRCERARELGVTAVFGKPWRNVDLLVTIERAIECCGNSSAAADVARAA